MMPGNRRAHSAYAVAIGTGRHALCRQLPEETAVALSYNGATQAVMMATPADLEDFALGFSLTEGLASPTEIDRVEHVETPEGIDLRIWLHSEAGARVAERRRSMTGPVGCGLCGIDSLAEAMRPPGVLPETGLRLGVAQVLEAVAALPQKQPLHDATRAVHAAGFFVPGQGLVAVREDVGRHNALDKLIGALTRAGIDPSTGALVMTSRLSVELVQKSAMAGCPVLIALSAPTATAQRLADTAGITLAAFARGGGFDLYAHPERIVTGASHVA